jgi:uncharacterized membrane protein/ribosomal protein L40E
VLGFLKSYSIVSIIKVGGAANMAFCRKCGSKIPDNAVFCIRCGAPAWDNKNTTDKSSYRKEVYTQQRYENTEEYYDHEDIKNNKFIAALSYLGILFIIPLIITPASKFARFHANQGLLLLITSFVLGLIRGIFSAILIAIFGVPFHRYTGGALVAADIITGLVSVVIGLVLLSFFILGVKNAIQGKAKELPIIGKFRVIK